MASLNLEDVVMPRAKAIPKEKNSSETETQGTPPARQSKVMRQDSEIQQGPRPTGPGLLDGLFAPKAPQGGPGSEGASVKGLPAGMQEPTKQDTNFLKQLFEKSVIGRTVQGVDDMANHGATLDQSFRQNFGDTLGGKVVTGVGDFFSNLKPSQNVGIQPETQTLIQEPVQNDTTETPEGQGKRPARKSSVQDSVGNGKKEMATQTPQTIAEQWAAYVANLSPNNQAALQANPAAQAKMAAAISAGTPPPQSTGVGNAPIDTIGQRAMDTSRTDNVNNGGSALNASPQMQTYDTGTQGALANGDPAQAMKLAQAAAAQTAQTQSDAAIRQAVKGAKTAGAMGGQAALMGLGAGADAYGQGLTQGTQQYFDTTKLGASLGSEMSQRLARQEQMAAQAAQAAAALKQQGSQNNAAITQGYINSGVNAVASLLPLFSIPSDKNLKEDIKPKDITRGLDKITGFAYKYKGSPRQEAGVMAQDLEKTAMKPAVMETPIGKVVDGGKLSTMNTAALSEHEKRLKEIEKLVKSLGSVSKPKGKE